MRSSTAKSTGPPKDADLITYMRKVAAVVQTTPALAPHAYAKAAARIRAESQKPENRSRAHELHALSRQIDALTAEAIVAAQGIEPTVDPQSDEGLDAYAPDEGGTLEEAEAEAEAAAAAPPAPASPAIARITPASADAHKTLFGQQAFIQYGASGNATGSYATEDGALSGAVVPTERAQVVRWEGHEVETMPCTVFVHPLSTLSSGTFPNRGITGTNYSYRTRFRARWGAGRGQLCEAVGDVGRGIQFTVGASFLYVDVQMEAPYPTYLAGSVWLNATMAFFSTTRTSPVYYTHYVDRLSQGSNTTFVIPAFATTIAGIFTPTLANFDITVRNAMANVIQTVSNAVSQTVGNAVVLANEAYDMQIVCNAGGTQDLQVVFGLTL